MTDAEFCSALETDLATLNDRLSAAPTAGGATPTSADPRADLEHLRNLVDRAPTSIHGPMAVYLDAASQELEWLYPSDDHSTTSLGTTESTVDPSEIMTAEPFTDAVRALKTYSTDTCHLSADDVFPKAAGSTGATRSPEEFDAALQAHLVAAGIGSETDEPRVDDDLFRRQITVTVSIDVDPVAACTAASDFTFGDTKPSVAARLVSIEQLPDFTIVAQRRTTDALCQTSGFVYIDISLYLSAEHPNAAWIDQISFGGNQPTATGYLYWVNVRPGTTDADALDICRQSAASAFGPRIEPAATSLEIRSSARGVDTEVIAHATSADTCAAGPPN